MEKIYTHHWIELPKEMREFLRTKLDIQQSGPAEIRDQTLISDGTTNNDLAAAVNKTSLEAYTGKTGLTFPELWMATLEKADQEMNPRLQLSAPKEIIEIPEEVIVTREEAEAMGIDVRKVESEAELVPNVEAVVVKTAKKTNG